MECWNRVTFCLTSLKFHQLRYGDPMRKALEGNGWFYPNLRVLYIIICFCSVIQGLASVFVMPNIWNTQPSRTLTATSERSSWKHFINLHNLLFFPSNTIQCAWACSSLSFCLCYTIEAHTHTLTQTHETSAFIPHNVCTRMCACAFFVSIHTNATTFTLHHNFHWNEEKNEIHSFVENVSYAHAHKHRHLLCQFNSNKPFVFHCGRLGMMSQVIQTKDPFIYPSIYVLLEHHHVNLGGSLFEYMAFVWIWVCFRASDEVRL